MRNTILNSKTSNYGLNSLTYLQLAISGEYSYTPEVNQDGVPPKSEKELDLFEWTFIHGTFLFI